MLYKVIVKFKSQDEILKYDWFKSVKATAQYVPVVLFIIPYKVIITFESLDEILNRDHLNESYWAVLSCDAVYYTVQSDSDV